MYLVLVDYSDCGWDVESTHDTEAEAMEQMQLDLKEWDLSESPRMAIAEIKKLYRVHTIYALEETEEN